MRTEMGSTPNDFSVVVLPSDFGIDSRPFLSTYEGEIEEVEENWHDCSQYLSADEDFSDLDFLQFFRLEGSDKSGNRILRIVGKFFPATVISGERLKKYILHKICSDLPEGPYCIVYMHSTVQKEDNSPGMTILRWIYEELPPHYKDRLQVVYFVHPGLRSRLVFATLGRFFLSGGKEIDEPSTRKMMITIHKQPQNLVRPHLEGIILIQTGKPRELQSLRITKIEINIVISYNLSPIPRGSDHLLTQHLRYQDNPFLPALYWKIKYISRLQYFWEDVRKGEIEIPEFVKAHDDILEHRPLTDYGIEPDTLHLTEAPSTAYSFGRHEERWGSREYIS